MAIDVQRIQADIIRIGACTHTPGNGATRPTFTTEWGRAVDYVVGEATKIGCRVRVDAGGNVFVKQASLPADVKTWLVGSHIDTVPHGGDYDGVTGIVVALEVLRSAYDRSFTVPVELVIFAEEEGPTFGLGMIGSRVLVGELGTERLAKLKNSDGKSYLEAGARFGVDPDRFTSDRLDPARHQGLLEVHIEQGPGMWRRDQRIAIVRAIAGRFQYQVMVRGEANHAGATSMDDRRDALAGAAVMVTTLESLARELSPETVITVGRLEVRPNAVNVIADAVEFTIDFRAPSDETLQHGDKLIHDSLEKIAQCRNLSVQITRTEAIPARPMNLRLQEGIAGSARATGKGNLPVTVSGALHDSAVIAPHLPTVMVFVPSKGGISHNPAEFSRVEDIAGATQVIEHFVCRPTIERLNQASISEFVTVAGGFFEHSPWVAEGAYDRKPFTSLADLHAKMCDVVTHAARERQLALIQAHPDLVGRLARENKLTRESTHEQAAAGLDALSAEEATMFETYNAAYHEQFGFPFVICARENRKDAILAAFPVRLKNTTDQEMSAALVEIGKIARLRIHDALWES